MYMNVCWCNVSTLIFILVNYNINIAIRYLIKDT